MQATTTNNRGKQEKNAKVMAGPCVFPFKYKREEHNACVETEKGDICATEVNPKTGTLTKYGYCENRVKKSTEKKALRSVSRKLKISNRKSVKQPSKMEKMTLKKRIPKKRTLKLASDLKQSPEKKVASGTKVSLMKRSASNKSEKAVKSAKAAEVAEVVVVAPVEATQGPKAYNEEFIDILGRLATIMLKQGEPFRARAYQKAQETVMTYPKDITEVSQLNGLPGIGKTILAKLEEYVKTGTLAVLEREKNNPINTLTDIYGVGPKKAQQLIDGGLTSIAQIKALDEAELKKLFNKNQLKGLQYYDDINQKIPRGVIVEFDELFQQTMAKCCGANTSFEIVGSFRRGKSESGDIDVIITNKDNDKSVFDKFIGALEADGVLEYSFSKGPTKSLTMCRLAPGEPIARRVDFLYTSPEEYPFAILYFTGSKVFNTVMRQRALSMGYTLNEHGLSHMKGGVKGQKVDHQFNNEKDIFDFLGMAYKAPNERIDGRAVQDKTEDAMENDAEVMATVKPDTIVMAPAEPVAASAQEEAKDTKEAKEAKETKNTVVKKKVVKRKTLKKAKGTSEEEEHAKLFKQTGISYIETLTEKQLADLIVAANDAYYNKTPFLTDDEFDIVKEYMERTFPNNNILALIGAPVEKGKVKLPYNMPSMNKIKPDTDSLPKWKGKYKGPYVLSAKLDGVSGMYVLEKGKKAKLYTRGDGTHGQDVSHLIPYMRFPKLGNEDKLVIRGEFIIKKALFTEKYAKDFSNPRNFVAGVINKKSKSPQQYRDIDFVAYEMIAPEVKPSVQFDMLKVLEIDLVWNKKVGQAKELTNDLLSNELVELRDNYEYEIDGVIVADDKIYKRTPENPEHAFAFKMVLSDQVAEVKVIDVLWSPSKDGYLKPRVQVEPVVLGGAKIEYATGFNAKFIEDNKIGVGAVIELVRSGDVIPHILKVVKPAATPMMPSMPWEWNPTHVDAVLVNKAEDETVRVKTLTLFFKHLDTPGMGPGNVKKMVDEGLTTVAKMYSATVPELQAILGKKTGMMAHENIHKAIDGASLAQLMTATNIFGRGFGDKRFVSIFEAIPDVLTGVFDKTELIAKVAAIKGLSSKSATEFVDKLPEFKDFLVETGLTAKLQEAVQKKAVVSGHALSGKKIVMTGFRDKALIAEIEKVGGEMSGSVSKNTFVVLVKDKDEDTGKADQARKLGVPLMTPDEFKAAYQL